MGLEKVVILPTRLWPNMQALVLDWIVLNYSALLTQDDYLHPVGISDHVVPTSQIQLLNSSVSGRSSVKEYQIFVKKTIILLLLALTGNIACAASTLTNNENNYIAWGHLIWAWPCVVIICTYNIFHTSLFLLWN